MRLAVLSDSHLFAERFNAVLKPNLVSVANSILRVCASLSTESGPERHKAGEAVSKWAKPF